MLVQAQRAGVFENILWSRYMGLKGLVVSKNPILRPDFLKNYTSEFLEKFFVNKPEGVLLVIKISIFPFQNCRR